MTKPPNNDRAQLIDMLDEQIRHYRDPSKPKGYHSHEATKYLDLILAALAEPNEAQLDAGLGTYGQHGASLFEMYHAMIAALLEKTDD